MGKTVEPPNRHAHVEGHAHAVDLGAHWAAHRPVAEMPHAPVDPVIGWTTDTGGPNDRW